jgi:hypothetical protein
MPVASQVLTSMSIGGGQDRDRAGRPTRILCVKLHGGAYLDLDVADDARWLGLKPDRARSGEDGQLAGVIADLAVDGCFELGDLDGD